MAARRDRWKRTIGGKAMEKRLYKVVTHLKDEYRHAHSAAQALALVWREYRGRGCDWRLRDGWTVAEVARK